MACPIGLVEDLPVRLDRSRGGKEPIITPNNDGSWFEVVGTQKEYDEARVFRAKLRASRWCWLRRRWTLGLVWVKHRLGMDSLHDGHRSCAGWWTRVLGRLLTEHPRWPSSRLG